MPQNEAISRSPGIRAEADGLPLGAVYGLACPALETEPLDTTPLNAEWRAQRPARKRAEDLKLRMLLRAGDPGQALLIAKYRSAEDLSLCLTLPDGQRLAWRGWVRRLALNPAHPGAPVSLEAAVCVDGGAEVSP